MESVRPIKKKVSKKETLRSLTERYEQLKLDGKAKEARLIKMCIARVEKIKD